MLEVGEILQHQIECFLVSLQLQVLAGNYVLAGNSLQPQVLAGNSLWQQMDLSLHFSVNLLIAIKLAIA
jgi:hypothetical protein